MKKYCFRITKYNPKNRNSKGYYLLDEWTSISDIHKYNINWCEYKDIESAYVSVVLKLLKEFNYSSLRLFGLEKNFDWNSFGDRTLKGLGKNKKIFYGGVENNNEREYTIEEIKTIIQFCLREMVWGVLFGQKLEIKTGHDFYLYIMTTDKEICNYLSNINSNKLFVERINEDIFRLDEDQMEYYGYTNLHLM